MLLVVRVVDAGLATFLRDVVQAAAMVLLVALLLLLLLLLALEVPKPLLSQEEQLAALLRLLQQDPMLRGQHLYLHGATLSCCC